MNQAHDPRGSTVLDDALWRRDLPHSRAVPRIIDGKYQILARLGEGGMARVFVAEHVKTGKRVALKVLNEEAARNPALVARAQVEARIPARIGSDRVVDTLDAGVTEHGEPYLVFELLEGVTLGKYLAQHGGVLPEDEAVAVVLELLAGLAAVHEKGVIHRDIKLDNVFVARQPSGPSRVKIIDFGVARVDADNIMKTGVGVALGTISYMPLEQIQGQQVDARADVYAAGTVLYCLLTGRLPYTGKTVTSIYFNKHGVAPRADVVKPGVNTDLATIVAVAIEPRAEARYPSAHAFTAALMAWWSAHREPSSFDGSVPDSEKWRALAALLAIALAAAVFATCCALAIARPRGLEPAPSVMSGASSTIDVTTRTR